MAAHHLVPARIRRKRLIVCDRALSREMAPRGIGIRCYGEEHQRTDSEENQCHHDRIAAKAPE